MRFPTPAIRLHVAIALLHARAFVAVFVMTALLGLTVLGCSNEPLLFGVALAPSEITPDRDGVEDVTRITYSVGRPAVVSIFLIGPDELTDRFALRQEKAREPGAGYETLFGGVIDGHMLADGEYTVSIEAMPDGESGDGLMIETRTLSIRNADAVAPVLEGFTVHPPTFSPNQDGINDRISISYRLDEPADVRMWLETASGDYIGDILAAVSTAERPGEPGPHVIDYDAGVDAGAPPPKNGDYFVVAEAKDAAGNIAAHRAPLRIENGGLPSAALVGDVEWSKTLVSLGETIYFTATVRNTGDTPVRTRGPEPGTVFDSDRSYNMPAPEEWLVVVRRGATLAGVKLPFVALPASVDFGAGDDAQINVADSDGPALCVRLDAPDGTIDESAEVYVFESDGDNGRVIEPGSAGVYCLATLDETPAIRRVFSRSPGSIRLGLAFDMLESSLEYPFRWQLGTIEDLEVCHAETGAYLCLPPDREVKIFGGVRFVEATYGHTGNAHLSLLHEDVRRMHGPYGVRLVTLDFDEPSGR